MICSALLSCLYPAEDQPPVDRALRLGPAKTPSELLFLESKVLDVACDPVVGKVSSVVARIAQQHSVRHAIGPFDHLVDCGMTSMAMVDLMLAIEAEFDLTIPQRDMTPANFKSIEALGQMLARLSVR